MVQILAPAGWLAQDQPTNEQTPEPTEVAATGGPSAAAGTLGWLRSHAVASAIGATGLLAACGVAAFLALRGDEQLASIPARSTALEKVAEPVAEAVVEPAEVVAVESRQDEPVDAEPAHSMTAAATDDVEPASAAIQEPSGDEVEVATSSSSSFLPLIKPPAIEEEPNAEPSAETTARKLTLEPVEPQPHSEPVTGSTATTANYPPAVETESANSEDKAAAATTAVGNQLATRETNPPSPEVPPRRTNVMDQLAVPIHSITLPDVPIGEFVGFVSTMTAVPIELDPKVLGEVGLSSRSTVTVHGEDTTAGKLLARVLKEHQLTCVERDGTLIVVRAKR